MTRRSRKPALAEGDPCSADSSHTFISFLAAIHAAGNGLPFAHKDISKSTKIQKTELKTFLAFQNKFLDLESFH